MEATRQLDESLSIRAGRLFIEEMDSVELAEQFGSPLFVYSEDQLRRNLKRFREAFSRGWTEGPVKIMPAAKANWLPAIQNIIAQEDCGCDVYSPGELSVALKAGFDPSFISVNGFPKDPDHIRRCIRVGARITIDSVEEVAVIEEMARALRKKAKVRLRIKAPLEGFTRHSEFVHEGLIATDLAALAYKNGLSFEDLASLAPRLRESKNLEVVGFHQHNGRHCGTLDFWEAQMKAYAREVARICSLLGGMRPRELDIGGGFPVPRDPFNAATHYSEPFQLAAFHLLSKGSKVLGNALRYRVLGPMVGATVKRPNQRRAPSIEEFAEVCTRTLANELRSHGMDSRGIMLQLEPGRSMHGNAGIHLATIRALKTVTSPISWRIIAVDTTEFWFTGGRYEQHLHDYVVANKADAPRTQHADIVGRSCYGDRLMPNVPMPDVEVGDLLAFLDTGAYQEVSTSNFNAMPRPATVLIRGSKAYEIRRRENEEELFRRDAIPGHLRKKTRGKGGRGMGR